VPFPTARLARIAHRALNVDAELSPLVQRTLSTTAAAPPPPGEQDQEQDAGARDQGSEKTPPRLVLRAEYAATTNRMLRVAVNSFIDGLKLVMEVMEKLDVDVDVDAGGGEEGKQA
jgi:EKC/KEOPS complex subunit PCC1/LAGE3